MESNSIWLWGGIVCFVFIMILCIAIYLLPTDPAKPKKKKEKKISLPNDPAAMDDGKDW